MTATHQPFSLLVGDTWVFDATLHDEEGTPLNIEAVAIVWRLGNAAGEIVATLAVNSGVAIRDPAKGVCRITFSAARSAALAPGTYYDEIVITLPSGVVSTQAIGRIDVTAAGRQPSPGTSSFSLDDWTAINTAIALGARSVTIKDRTVTYASLDDMLRVRSMIGRELGILPRFPSTVLIEHHDGRRPRGSNFDRRY